MTRGTIHSFNSTRGTGTLISPAGTLVPFSTRHRSLHQGGKVTFRLTGGLVGLYADHVQRDVLAAHSNPAQS